MINIMTSRIINAITKSNFINIMSGNIPTYPLVIRRDRCHLNVKKRVYYEGEMFVNDIKIDNVRFTKTEIINTLKDSKSTNIKVFNDKDTVVINFEKLR